MEKTNIAAIHGLLHLFPEYLSVTLLAEAKFPMPVSDDLALPNLPLSGFPSSPLDHEAFHLILQSANLALEVGCFVGGNGAADDCARDTAGTTESHLGRNVHLNGKSQFMLM